MGDRFIPTQIRSGAFQVESHLPQKEVARSTYEEMLEKNILQNKDSNFSNKIMSFGKGTKNKVNSKANKENISQPL